MLGKTLKTLRERQGLSVIQLAEKLQINRHSVYKWETNENTPSLEKLEQLGKLYGYNIERIMSGRLLKKNQSTDITTLKELDEQLSRATQTSHISRTFSDFLHSHGANYFSYMQLHRSDMKENPTPILLSNLSKEWMRIYVENRYINFDTTWKNVLTHTQPIFSDQLAKNAHETHNHRVAKLYTEMIDHGMAYFVSIPVHGTCCLSSTTISISTNTEKKRLAFKSKLPEFTLAAHHLYHHMHRIQKDRELAHTFPSPLSPHEIEAVKGKALGFTNEQIARQLNISASAVFARIRRAKEKLKASNEAQLVAIAISNNLLPHDFSGMRS